MKFYIVDAFVQEAFGGNPAGVIILEDGENFPPDNKMKSIAAELRYSETAFIKVLTSDSFQIRYFTPEVEVELCGHATIASFTALIDAGLCENNKVYKNKTLAGEINVALEDGKIIMDMAPAKALDKIIDRKDLDRLYQVMGSQYEEILAKNTDGKEIILSPQIVSTGLMDIMLPTKNFEALNSLSPNMEQLTELSNEYGVIGVHAFCLDESDNEITAHTRNFGPACGIDEEAATGTSSGALTYYLYSNNLVPNIAEIEFIQGEAMNRPSHIICQIDYSAGDEIIRVGGFGKILAKGEFFI